MHKVFTIGAVAALSLTLGVGPVAAQDDAASAAPSVMEPAVATGEGICDGPSCVATMSDPRVSGTIVLNWLDEVSLPGGTVAWGDVRLFGPGGSWTCQFVSTQVGQSTIDYLVTLDGSGGYEGWAFVGTRTEQRNPDQPNPFKGVIYEGSAPAPLSSPIAPPLPNAMAATTRPSPLFMAILGRPLGALSLLRATSADGVRRGPSVERGVLPDLVMLRALVPA